MDNGCKDKASQLQHTRLIILGFNRILMTGDLSAGHYWESTLVVQAWFGVQSYSPHCLPEWESTSVQCAIYIMYDIECGSHCFQHCVLLFDAGYPCSRGAFKDNITNEYVSVYMIPSWSQLDVTPQKCPLIYKIAHPLWDYGCFIEVTAYTGWGCICYAWMK